MSAMRGEKLRVCVCECQQQQQEPDSLISQKPPKEARERNSTCEIPLARATLKSLPACLLASSSSSSITANETPTHTHTHAPFRLNKINKVERIKHKTKHSYHVVCAERRTLKVTRRRVLCNDCQIFGQSPQTAVPSAFLSVTHTQLLRSQFQASPKARAFV